MSISDWSEQSDGPHELKMYLGGQVSEQATVRGQLAGLFADVESGEVPEWDRLDYTFNLTLSTWHLNTNQIDTITEDRNLYWSWDLDSDVCEILSEGVGVYTATLIGEFDVNSCT